MYGAIHALVAALALSAPQAKRGLDFEEDPVSEKSTSTPFEAPPPGAKAAPEAKGAKQLAPDEFRKVIRSHTGEVAACYQQALAKKADDQGKLVLKFVVSPSGKVTSAKVASSTLADPALGPCVTKAAKAWSFPDVGAVTTVNYPFVFKPAEK